MTKAERHALYTTLVVPVMAIVVLTEAPLPVAFAALVISVMALLWLVWVVLHDTASPPPDLMDGHEWDYLDRSDLMERDEEGRMSNPSRKAGK
jgi:membrane protein implicated in regulation of membrane protease activity